MAAKVIGNHVLSDAVNPRRHAIGVFKIVKAAMNANERLLKQIVGNVVGRNPTANVSPQVFAQMRPDAFRRNLRNHGLIPDCCR